jgi:hypothetical protein
VTEEIFSVINKALRPNQQEQTTTNCALKFKALALECGFLSAGDKFNIDWGHNYTKEFEDYSHELVRWTCELMKDELAENSYRASKLVVKHFQN